MSMPAWQLLNWPPVYAKVSDLQKSVRRMRHLGTSVLTDGVEGELSCGQVLWGCDAVGSKLGIAWDWREVRPELVALSDPMTLLSNVTLVDDDGKLLSDSAKIVHLNDVVYRLGWQSKLRPILKQTAQHQAATVEA